MKILARHKDWVNNCVITESVNDKDTTYRRFTATIDKWRNFKIYEGFIYDNMIEAIINRIKTIQTRIENNDNSVFYENVELYPIKSI